MKSKLSFLLVGLAMALVGCGGPDEAGPASSPQGLTAGTSVFADALDGSWADWSWATHNLAATSPVSSGTRSISVTYGAWTGLYFHSNGVSLAGASALQLRANGGQTDNPAIAVKVTVGGVEQTRVDLGPYCAGGKIPGGAWTTCTIPVSALGATGATIDGIYVQENAGALLPEMYFDDVQFVAPPDVTVTAPQPAPSPAPSVAIYGDALATDWSDWSRAKINLANGSPVAAGTRSIAVTYGPRQALYLHGSGVSLAGYSHLEFRLHGGANRNARLAAKVTVGGVEKSAVSVGPYCTGGRVPARAWTTCQVPLSALGATGATIDGVQLQESAGKYLSVMYADELKVVSVGTQSTPVALVAITASPSSASLETAATQQVAATVTGTANTAVTWSVTESGGGTVSSTGLYTAPGGAGTYHVVARSAADSTKTATATMTVSAQPPTPQPPQPPTGNVSILPSDRRTVWDPGIPGGIPAMSTIFRTLTPSGGDDTSTIQAALDACPYGQVVKLGAGTFKISGQGLTIGRSGVVLRGSGPGNTKLVKTKGTMYPVIIIGTRWYDYTASIALAADAVKDSTTLKLASTPSPALVSGDLLVVNETTDSSLSAWSSRSPPGDASRGWFGEMDRPLGQVVEVASVSGNTVTTTAPFHITLQAARGGHVLRFSNTGRGGPAIKTVSWSGIEDLYVANGEGGDGGGNIHLFATSYSWVKNVESDASIGSSVNLDGTFRCELRDSYLHSTLDPNPGGGGYGITLNKYAADNLVENNISWSFNKVIIMRTTGGGNVVGYNYMEDGYGSGYPTIPEVGLNASHMTTPHMELFEGNESWAFGSDAVWGNSIYITAFRNHLTGLRRSVFPLHLTDSIERHAVDVGQDHWWYSFLGNVLGFAGMPAAPQKSFVVDGSPPWAADPAPMWMIGNNKDGTLDATVAARTLRHGNYDYVSNKTTWDPTIADHNLPASMYLKAKPAFMGANAWPWVTPEDAASPLKGKLPARARFDAIHGL